MNTRQKQALIDYGILTLLVVLLFWGGLATLGCGVSDVPGGGLVEGQEGVTRQANGGIGFDITNTQVNVARYRVPRYASLSGGAKPEYNWTCSPDSGAEIVGPDPDDPEYILVNIHKDESRLRTVYLEANYTHNGRTSSAFVRNVQVYNE